MNNNSAIAPKSNFAHFSLFWLIAFLAFFSYQFYASANTYNQLASFEHTVITASAPLPDLTIDQQKLLLESLNSFGPNSRRLRLYYINKSDPIFSFATPDFMSILYQMSAHNSGANCYYASHLALGTASLPERFMDLNEFNKLVSLHYTLMPKNHVKKPGDILRLVRSRGRFDTHSVVYLGKAGDTEGPELVLTKNGPQDGPFLIMSLWDLTNLVYPGSNSIEVYRSNSLLF